MKSFILCISLSLFLTTGCASSIQNLQRESARNIGNNLTPTEISVTEVDRSAMNVRWKATAPDGSIYNCSADDMVRRVNCVK
ncbi:hypothetical protein [Desulforhopalus sp. 52FAK]